MDDITACLSWLTSRRRHAIIDYLSLIRCLIFFLFGIVLGSALFLCFPFHSSFNTCSYLYHLTLTGQYRNISPVTLTLLLWFCYSFVTTCYARQCSRFLFIYRNENSIYFLCISSSLVDFLFKMLSTAMYKRTFWAYK